MMKERASAVGEVFIPHRCVSADVAFGEEQTLANKDLQDSTPEQLEYKILQLARPARKALQCSVW